MGEGIVTHTAVGSPVALDVGAYGEGHAQGWHIGDHALIAVGSTQVAIGHVMRCEPGEVERGKPYPVSLDVAYIMSLSL